MPDVYDGVDATWPATVPPLSRVEAERAARKLAAHFSSKRPMRVRKAWITTETSRLRNTIHRGWRRMVHDISHYTWSTRAPHLKDHGIWHANLEREMVEYVLLKGWLTGSLKPKPKVKAKPTPSDKMSNVLVAIARWETKRKRAEAALKKLRIRARYYNNKLKV